LGLEKEEGEVDSWDSEVRRDGYFTRPRIRSVTFQRLFSKTDLFPFFFQSHSDSPRNSAAGKCVPRPPGRVMTPALEKNHGEGSFTLLSSSSYAWRINKICAAVASLYCTIIPGIIPCCRKRQVNCDMCIVTEVLIYNAVGEGGRKGSINRRQPPPPHVD